MGTLQWERFVTQESPKPMVDVLRRLIGGNWGSFNWGIYELLTSPRFVSLSILLIMATLVIGSYPQWRKRILRGLMILLVAYWILISPPLAALTEGILMSFVPPDRGETADAIVVIGRGYHELGDRYPVAMSLLEQGRAPRLFVTGRSGFRYIADLTEDYDISLNQLSGSVCGRTTKDEAFASAVILGTQGVETIILITDRPHMLRAYLTFQGRGFKVIPHPVDLTRTSSARRSILTLREYMGLVSYALLGRLWPGSPETLRNPTAELVQDVKNRGCEATPQEKPELFQASRSSGLAPTRS